MKMTSTVRYKVELVSSKSNIWPQLVTRVVISATTLFILQWNIVGQ